MRCVAFSAAPSSSLAVALGDRAIVLRSTDQGASWAELNAPHAVNDSFALADGSDSFYVGSVNGVIWRTDLAQLDGWGALEWESRSLPVTATNVTGLHFIDADTGYAVTDTMQLYETTNGGAVWTQVGITGSPNTQVLEAVRTWGDGSKAIAVGENGMVLARVGAQFQQVNLAAATGGRALLCVEVVDGGKQAFVGGNDGLLLHFSGSSFSDVTNLANWSTPKSQASNAIVDMSFDAPDHGFVFAPPGVVIEYD